MVQQLSSFSISFSSIFTFKSSLAISIKTGSLSLSEISFAVNLLILSMSLLTSAILFWQAITISNKIIIAGWPAKLINHIQNSIMQQQRKLKQQYLRTEVLQKNYDPEEFIHFLNEKLKIDSDIDKCSFEELKAVVKEFICEKQNNIIDNMGSLSASQTVINRGFDQKRSSVVFKEYNNPVVEEQFETNHKCIKLANKYSAEQLSKIKCEVNNPERKYSGGLLGIGATSFLEFQVKIQALGWCVGRRYSDFIWLRNILKKFYPSQIIPPIPDKKASKRTVRHIQKRMRILSYFLNDLVKIPSIFCSKYVQGFLSIKQNNKFEQLKKQGDSKLAFESISSIQTQTGFVKISLSNENLAYCSGLKKFAAKTQVLYKQITRASKRLQAQRVDEVNQLYLLGNKFAQLYETGKEFENVVKCQGISHLNEIFIKINNMMIEWGNNIKNEIDLLQVNFNTFFKYCRESYMGFKENIAKLNEFQKEFIEKKYNLDVKKEKIFLLHDPNRWEISKKEIPFIPKSSIHQRTEAFKIMLPKQSIEVQKIKLNYSFYLSQMFQNSTKYFERQALKFNENFKQFSIRNKVNNQQLGENWNEMCLIFSETNSCAKKLKQMDMISQYKENANMVIDD